MASFLGVPYRDVMIAALFPALLYYGALFVMVRLRALKKGLKGLPPDELPSKREVLKRFLHDRALVAAFSGHARRAC